MQLEALMIYEQNDSRKQCKEGSNERSKETHKQWKMSINFGEIK
jgi:hypothetical protein